MIPKFHGHFISRFLKVLKLQYNLIHNRLNSLTKLQYEQSYYEKYTKEQLEQIAKNYKPDVITPGPIDSYQKRKLFEQVGVTVGLLKEGLDNNFVTVEELNGDPTVAKFL